MEPPSLHHTCTYVCMYVPSSQTNQAKSSQAKSDQAKPSQARSSQVKPSQVKPSQAKSNQAKPSQAKPSQAKPSHFFSQVKSSQPVSAASPLCAPSDLVQAYRRLFFEGDAVNLGEEGVPTIANGSNSLVGCIVQRKRMQCRCGLRSDYPMREAQMLRVRTWFPRCESSQVKPSPVVLTWFPRHPSFAGTP